MTDASDRTYRVLDVETTGLAPPAEIIEIGYCDVAHVSGLMEIGEPRSKLFAPDVPCPPEVVAIHHITASDLLGAETCTSRVLASLAQKGADAIVAHNSGFEGLWFTPEILGKTPLICTLKAAYRVWPDAPGHSNQVLRYWLGLDLPASLAMPPHRAGPDAYVTAHIFQRLMDHATVDQMIAWTAEPRLLPSIPIGKQRGAKWPDVDGGFLHWMMKQSDMATDLRWNAQRELDRRSGHTATVANA